MATRYPLGLDMHYRGDLDRGGRDSSGEELVLSAMIHRLTVDTLPLIGSPNDEEDYGDDIRKWCGEPMTPNQLSVRAAGLGPILERDERIVEADVGGTITSTRGAPLLTFDLDINAKLSDGSTLSRRLAVSSVTVEFLSQGR